MIEYNLTKIKTNSRQGIKLIINAFAKDKKALLLAILLVTISTLIASFIPQLIKIAIDDYIANKDYSGLGHISLFFLCLVVVFFFTTTLQTRTTGMISQKALFNLRARIFDKLQQLPLAFFSQNRSGDIMQRLTANVEGINRFFSEGIIRLLNISLSITGFSIIMLVIQPILGIIVIAGGVVIITYLVFQGIYLRKQTKKALDEQGSLSAVIQESLNGFSVIKSYSKEEAFEGIIRMKNASFFKQANIANLISSLSDGVLPFITITSAVIVLIVSLKLYSTGQISQGGVIAFLSYVITFFRRFEGLSNLWSNIQNGLASAQRINEILQLDSNIKEIDNPYSPAEKDIKGRVEFLNVCLSYDNKSMVLKNISLIVPPGKTIALVGPTGGGKTSFVNLIARLYDTVCGKVIIDNIDIKSWNLKMLRESIGYLIQDSVFFSGTIKDNLKYANPEASDDQILQALSLLGADKIISAMPKGLETQISPDNFLISAGQKQVLALVRLVLRDPRILILDEATANIDTKTEKIIQKALDKIRQGRTTFIIAHRLSTIISADQIILIQNNTILESGTHQELIQSKGKYYEIYSKFIGK